jgi:hypothetical protein
MLQIMSYSDDLSGTEVYLFTDNSIAKAAFCKDSSISKKLHELVTDSREMKMEFGVKFVLCHVAGERMIHQGTDGLSEVISQKGIMEGEEMITFNPYTWPHWNFELDWKIGLGLGQQILMMMP